MMKHKFAIFLVMLFLALSGAGDCVFAQTREIEARKEKIKSLEADIDYLDKQILSTQKKQKNTMDELVLVQRKIANRKKLLAELDVEIKSQTREMANIQKNISNGIH